MDLSVESGWLWVGVPQRAVMDASALGSEGWCSITAAGAMARGRLNQPFSMPIGMLPHHDSLLVPEPHQSAVEPLSPELSALPQC